MKSRFSCNSLTVAVALAASCITAGAFAQDECAGAPSVTAGVPVAFDTTTATPSANTPTDALCAGTFLNWLATQNDVWFTFTATEAGLADFSTCFLGSYDTSMALYKGDCNTMVACNGDGPTNTTCQAYYSIISGIQCAAGDVFYVRLGGYEGDVGAGQLLVTFSPAAAGCVGATGACNVVHATTGCDNATCCTSICGFNPLCCDVGWDADCVALAVSTCGYYSCGPVAGAPANNCATSPTVVSGLDSTVPFTTVGATNDGPTHPGATCQSGSDLFDGDIWFRATPIANGSMRVSTCGTSSFDNKLAVYDLGTDPAAFDYNNLAAALVICNDDGASGTCFLTDGVTPYASELSATVQLGHSYLVRMGAYAAGDTGSGSVLFDMPEACSLATPTGAEGEDCGGAINDGCNADGGAIPVLAGSITAGTFWADADTRDTDFYSLTVGADSQLNVSVRAARLCTVLLLTGDISVAGCAGVSVIGTGTGNCPNVASACLNPGTYYVFVADAAFAGNPCGSGAFNDYTLEVTTTPATCPVTVSGGGATAGTCAAPGPNNVSINADPNTVANGLVACAVAGATGGTTANSYARVFAAGSVAGDISCLSFGAYAARNIAGALYYSDLPLPATIGIYRDLDGGTPRFKTADGGVDGGDLDPIRVTQVMIPGGVFKAVLNYGEAVCVEEDAASNLVVVIDFPSMYAGVPSASIPAASGYNARAGGNTAGPVQNTYCRLSCADAAGQFVLTESLGATFTAQWVVEINGDNAAACSAPACPADFNGDSVRNGLDLTVILSNWGGPGGDTNGDGVTNGLDLTVLLSGWGPCPN